MKPRLWSVLFVLLVFALNAERLSGLADGINARNVVVSVAIDAESPEIMREGLRLFLSIEMFGESLKNARRSVCISHSGAMPVEPAFLRQLKALNVSDIYTSQRYSLPDAAPTLNKLCAFEPRLLNADDYLLYLDADIFVATDPLPLLAAHAPLAPTTVLCGRPWDAMKGDMHMFPDFVGDVGRGMNFYQREILETLSEPGFSFYGTCNTGVYFMHGEAAGALVSSAREYLHKARMNPAFTDRVPFSPVFNGVDSVILWAAQYERGFEVDLLSPRLNWMAAAESHYSRFVAREIGVDWQGNPSLEAVRGRHAPSLIHFSRGSDLRFSDNMSPIGSVDDSCLVHLTALRDDKFSYVEAFAREHLTRRNVCTEFAKLLKPYDPLVGWDRESRFETVASYSIGDVRVIARPTGQEISLCSTTFFSAPRLEPVLNSAFFTLVAEVFINCSKDGFGAEVVHFTAKDGEWIDAKHAAANLGSNGDLITQVRIGDLVPRISEGTWAWQHDKLIYETEFTVSIGGTSSQVYHYKFDIIAKAVEDEN